VARLLLILTCLFAGFGASAFASDSTHVYQSSKPGVTRAFDDDALEEFRNDSDFIYHVQPRKEEGLFDRIIGWILYYLLKTLAFITGTVPGKLLFYTFCVLLILYAVIKLFDIDVKEMFYSMGKPKQGSMTIQEEDIHEISFDERIDEAYRNKDYRECVRLNFLYALKKLSDKDLIQWKAGKTNDDYMRELKEHPTKPTLQELRLYFDYAWYGHFEVDEDTYRTIRNVFGDFSNKIV